MGGRVRFLAMDVRGPPFAAYLRDFVQRAALKGQVRDEKVVITPHHTTHHPTPHPTHHHTPPTTALTPSPFLCGLPPPSQDIPVLLGLHLCGTLSTRAVDLYHTALACPPTAAPAAPAGATAVAPARDGADGLFFESALGSVAVLVVSPCCMPPRPKKHQPDRAVERLRAAIRANGWCGYEVWTLGLFVQAGAMAGGRRVARTVVRDEHVLSDKNAFVCAVTPFAAPAPTAAPTAATPAPTPAPTATTPGVGVRSSPAGRRSAAAAAPAWPFLFHVLLALAALALPVPVRAGSSGFTKDGALPPVREAQVCVYMVENLWLDCVACQCLTPLLCGCVWLCVLVWGGAGGGGKGRPRGARGAGTLQRTAAPLRRPDPPCPCAGHTSHGDEGGARQQG